MTITDSEFAKLLGKSDAHEIGVRLEAVKDTFRGMKDLSGLPARVEEVMDEVQNSSKTRYPELFQSDDLGSDYWNSLTKTLKALRSIAPSELTRERTAAR